MSVRILRPPEVLDEIAQIAIDIDKENPSAADRFLDEIERTITSLAEMPSIGRVFETSEIQLADIRVFAVRNFPNYLIFYKHLDNAIKLLLVVHGARDIPTLFEKINLRS